MAVTDSEAQLKPARRTQRVHIALPVIVWNTKFREESLTISVSGHGCLVMLTAKVSRDDEVWLINPKTSEELPAKVVFSGKPDGEKTPVGIEFSEPSPVFWRINFPPDDWVTSSERKRSGSP